MTITPRTTKRQLHLHQRPGSQHWQLRLMVPIAARDVLGRREFTKSLGVTDRRRAADLAHSHLADWKAQIDRALATSVGGIDPDTATIDARVLDVSFDRASNRVPDLILEKAQLGSAAYDALPEEFERRHRDARRKQWVGDLSYWQDRIRTLIQDEGWSIKETDPRFRRMVDLFAAGGIDTLAYAKLLAEGKEGHFRPSIVVREAQKRRESTAPQGEGIKDLFERYAAQRLAEGRKRRDTVDQDRKVIDLFAEYVGVQRRLSSITMSEVREWRDAVAFLPPAYRKRRAYEGLTLRQSIEKARKEDAQRLTPTTINKYLSTVSPLFDWARQQGFTDANPCDGLFFDIQKRKRSGKSRRPPFSNEQLVRIFSSALFAGCLRDGREWEAGEHQVRDWRYWIPLVCLFTGARIGEIAQLRVEDLREQGGLPYILIRDDEQTGQTTKSGFSRPAPIHSKLSSLGFLDFVEGERRRAENDGDARLFPTLQPNARGQISWTPSRFWRGYLTRLGIKNGRDGFGSHSFRHSLTDQLRLAGYLDDEIEVALGHNQSSVTAGYGQVKQGTVKRLHSMLEEVKFAEVDALVALNISA